MRGGGAGSHPSATKPLLKRRSDIRPFRVENRVPGGVAVLSLADEHVLAMDPLGDGGERREGRIRSLVCRIRLELDPSALEGPERVLELQQLGLRVGARAPGLRREPRPADLEASMLRPERQVAR